MDDRQSRVIQSPPKTTLPGVAEGKTTTGISSNASPKLMEMVRGKMRMLHLSKRTEEAYVGWILDFLTPPSGKEAGR